MSDTKTMAQRVAGHLMMVLDKHTVTTLEEKRADLLALGFLQEIAEGTQIVVEAKQETDRED